MEGIIFSFTVFVSLANTAWATNLPPAFSLDMNNLVLSERTLVGTVVYKLEGTDPEESPVHYGLHGTDRLKVNRDTGDVTVVKPLDREVNDTLKFFVTIEDEVKDAPLGGNNVVEVPVTVIILDENDNAPVFEGTPYDIQVDEDALIGATIFSNIRASDADSVGNSLEMVCVDLPDYPDACQKFEVVTFESSQNAFLGGIVLKQKLNYSESQEYVFLLEATDGELTNTTKVSIKIGDVQDTPPYFVGPLGAVIGEDAPINSLVLTIHAEDGDRGLPRKIAYELVDNPYDFFSIDSSSGEIRTAKPLDREVLLSPDNTLTLNVKARELVNGVKSDDPLTISEATVTIKITDVNDEPPIFNQREYHVEIPEDIPSNVSLPNLNITVTDPDEGLNAIFSLSLQDISGAFAIQPSVVNGSSQVKIYTANSSLDYEDPNQRKFIILIVAKELYTDPLLSSTATVKISVTDANDNAPEFPQEAYVAQVSEMATGGTLVTSIVAKDRDSGRFGENGLVYQLVGNGAEKFEVNNRTGTVTVATCEAPGQPECLDYETKPEYSLSFKATDDDGKGQTTIVPLKIILTDSNDNPPRFSQSIYHIFVDEGAVKFNPDVVIEATDIDKISHISYSIIAGNNNNLFSIDPNTGKIRIANSKGLSLKSGNDEDNNIVLNVEASDGKYTATTQVSITVKDINDNPPIFTKESYMKAIPEDLPVASTILEVQAVDADMGDNAKIEYEILKGSFNDFEIDSETGEIILVNDLDYDRRNTYNIEVIAMDHGTPSLNATARIILNVLNVNDKSPYFVPVTQKASIMEDAPVGTIVHTLVALDPDVNSSEALNFAVTEPITALDKYGQEVTNDLFKDFFSVDKTTGKVTVLNPLERDVAAVIRIPVLVTDITAPSVQQGEGLLIINIIDVNDHAPQFLPPWTIDNPVYELEVKEELPVGTIVATYTAIDEDSEIAGYIIIPPSEYFEINNGTGIVQIKKQIDYEKLRELNFTVVVFDLGIPQLNTSALVKVHVINVNDNDPTFSQKTYNVKIPENSPNGTHVLTVLATDADAGEYGIVTYSLTGEHKEHFNIDSETGEITVANSNYLDHEIINETVIQVVASDRAPGNLKRSVSVPINIEITDVNDNAPKFNQSVYNATVMENARLNPPVPILQVFATDLDEGNNGNVAYRILSGNDNGTFLLGIDTGILYPHKSLVDQPHNHQLIVEARDGEGNGELSDRAIINIQVVNVNEHKPRFVMPTIPNATVEIIENDASEGYLVMTLKAIDKDVGKNGKVTYHIKVNGSLVSETEDFILNKETGELKMKRALDRETKSKYELVLVAKDHGFPLWHETEEHLKIILVDMNDNRPEFPDTITANPYRFSIVENSEKEQKIGQVRALDRDEGRHAKVFYYLICGSEDDSFKVGKLDGSIFTNKVFDREEKSEYNLCILATNEPDFYISPEEKNKLLQTDIAHNSSFAKVHITIVDLNDNEPKFKKSTYYASVSAMAPVNKFLVNVTATDPDEGVNGTLIYYVKASNLYKYGSTKSSGSIIPSPFNITQKGELTTATYLAENNQHRFVVDVVAKEVALPEREAIAKVNVWIFEPQQLIRVILSRPVGEVLQEQEEIIEELSNATQSLIVLNEIRYHTELNGKKNENWSDMYILAVNPSTYTVLPVPEVLKVIDAKYDYLRDYYAGYAIENVLPAFIMEKEELFDPALAALIALLIVLFVGIITFIVVCCCLRRWMITPNKLKKKDALIKKAIIDDLNTTENPLWIEQKLKIYEEQELTMQVFNEPEHNGLERNGGEMIQEDNTYATIQHPHRRGSSHIASMSIADETADYATLSRVPVTSNSPHSTIRGTPNYYEAAMGFQGSTFQVPDPIGGYIEVPEDHNQTSSRSNDNHHKLVAELI
ncbi:cadherin-87A [Agrilus planipennis]|uniref:Cadherin-87A n=1 Tax=Agrilus planipennis TaxID=224129 RepID=A0A7F5R2N4_AGRPL|nr:cadherin-87A [Agrilus planipennis]